MDCIKPYDSGLVGKRLCRKDWESDEYLLVKFVGDKYLVGEHRFNGIDRGIEITMPIDIEWSIYDEFERGFI